MKKLLKVALFSSLLFLTACPNPPPAEDPCNFVQNSLKRRVSWARTPIVLYVDDSLLSIDVGERGELAALDSLSEAVEFWNDQFDTPVFNLVGLTDQLPDPQLAADGRVIPDTFNGIYVVEPQVFRNTTGRDEQARTSINFRGDFIYEADILIDSSERFYFEDQNQPAGLGEVQFKSLMIHELGHVLGLGHVEIDGTDSVMYPRLQFGQMRPQPTISQEGVVQLNSSGATALELPEVDQGSLACEYQ